MPQPRKRFGQHFLQDKNIIYHIISAINPKPEDCLVEIGPGQGALTFPLIESCPELKLNLIEIDKDLVSFLKNQFSKYKLKFNSQSQSQSQSQLDHLNIFETDVLKFDFAELKSKQLRIIGNLPYNISTPLLFHLVGYKDIIKDMYFMLQKEVVDRMSAVPRTKDYGRLSIMIQYDFDVIPLFDVPPSAFYPPPKVNSTVVKLTPKIRSDSEKVVDKNLFQQIVREAFQHRRKTLRNALKKHLTEEAMMKYHIDPTLRPEVLSVEDYVKLSNQMSHSMNIKER